MTTALLADRIPLPGVAPAQCDHVFEELGLTFDASARVFLDSVFACAPYLARLAQRRPETLASLSRLDAEAALELTLSAVREAGRSAVDVDTLDRCLRQAKADMHLITALADLSGDWPVMRLTEAVTRFADAAVQAALLAHIRLGSEQGRFEPVTDTANPLPGLIIFALGKMGAGELNYSSDIDLVVFFDLEALRLPEDQEPRQRLPRLVQAVAKSLNDVTADGYVFRTDLRLRPDPGATPVAISTDAALNYYESLGMTWERAAWIKARCCAGDAACGRYFLDQMKPFIWRRALDYAAVDDIRALARQIQTVGRRAKTQAAGHDLKLGRGGIREIEFYAQIPQLVFGGRDPAVRTPATLDALAALAARGAVDAATVVPLREDYLTLRALEHRVQMRQDEQSQTLPEDDVARSQIAAMAGFAGLADFDGAVETLLQRVHGHFSEQFEADNSLSSNAGSLVLTGVEPTPDTLKTLRVLKFEAPEQVWRQLNAWAGGRARAVRSDRARALFAQLAPRLIDTMAETGEPDKAFTRFAAFFENLPFGVQPLSLLANESGLAADLIGIITMAPKLAVELSRRPELIDSMLDARFSIPVDQDAPDAVRDRLMAQLAHDPGYETALNATRRIVREERLRIGTQLLRGRLDAQTAGAAFSGLADAAIEVLADAARSETERKYGPMPGRFAVIGMGKLGGRELSASSDLDIVVVYDGDEATQTWFTRFTQRLVSALSVPTEEGELYEVDMQLRPSGKAGPVAVQFARFSSYYAGEAWTWELLALTRARLIAGDPGLCDRLIDEIDRLLHRPRDPEAVLADARDMRRRLQDAKPARSAWDLKVRPGGVQDIEFIAQTLQLTGITHLAGVRASTSAALAQLAKTGQISVADARFLIETLHLYLTLSQIFRLTHGAGFDPETASRACMDRLTGSAGVSGVKRLTSALEKRSKRVRRLYNKLLQDALEWNDGVSRAVR